MCLWNLVFDDCLVVWLNSRGGRQRVNQTSALSNTHTSANVSEYENSLVKLLQRRNGSMPT